MARRELHHAGGEGNEEAGERSDPDHEDAGTGGSGGCCPANTEDHNDVEEHQVAKAETSLECGSGGHVGRRIAEGRRRKELNPAQLNLSDVGEDAMAALRPLMPMTEPPGWVQAPQR